MPSAVPAARPAIPASDKQPVYKPSIQPINQWVRFFFKHPTNARNPIYFKSFFFKSEQNAPRSKSNPDLLRGIGETSMTLNDLEPQK